MCLLPGFLVFCFAYETENADARFSEREFEDDFSIAKLKEFRSELNNGNAPGRMFLWLDFMHCLSVNSSRH